MSSGVFPRPSGQRSQPYGAAGVVPALEPAMASDIARKLLQFHHFNRMRQLVDELIGSDVTPERFLSFTRLCRDHELSVPEYLLVEVYNLMRHIDQGIELPRDALHLMPAKKVEILAREAATAAATTGDPVSLSLRSEQPNRGAKKPR